ncbi:hypothetical protein C2S51_034417 [Perilla frutescens var. frutescens]|nr:hypothetical protein C2S51_034417 [Perilla frutescens var. frutescens]
MAYAAVASLSETIDVILKYHEECISTQLKNQITHLQKQIIFLRSFLEESPDDAQLWEERMREVTNEAEDIIELLLSDSLLDSSEPKLKRRKYELRYDFDELERVIKKIESIVKGVKERRSEVAGSVDDKLMQIIDQLRGGSSALESTPIVGMGGIGKTTLARKVYNHPSIVKHFKIRAWVTVSQNYSRRGIILSLLRSTEWLSAQSISSLDYETLCAHVYNMLYGERYLIVLDDVWSAEVWEWLKDKIPVDFNGSRILITARLLDVACRVGFYSRIHEMCLMNVDHSWNLLRHKIFKQDLCPPKLECMGKLIAGSCRGLPLSIEVVSGILAADQTQATWEDIAENLKIAMNCKDDEHILHILHLSYAYLPHHLRPCFLYLGMFPEDHKICVSKLIKLWEAEGFVNESEETGEEYLQELVKRSLVSIRKSRYNNGRMKRVSIHDLVRDFCTRQARADNFFLHVTESLAGAESVQLQRRVSVADRDDILQNVDGSSTVRTMICLEGKEEGIRWSSEYFRLLRILDLSEGDHLFFKSDDFPIQVFELFHLRYLAFVVDRFNSIPNSISKLENLQTLIIRSSDYPRGIVKLPVEIWRMRQLRHVLVFSCVLPTQEEETPSALENLETLNELLNFVCSRETLEMIPNLKKLCISYTRWGDYEIHNLIHFQKLETLEIEMHRYVGERWRKIPLAFPPTLKKLSLRSVRVPWEDMEIVGSLPNLQELRLRNPARAGSMWKLRSPACVGSTWETNEGGFPQLQFLLIKRSDLEQWITKSDHFPSLKCLVVRDCRLLREIPKNIRKIPTLELIEFV